MPGHGLSDVVCTPFTTQSTFFLDLEPAVEIYLRGVGGYEEIGYGRRSYED